LSTKTAPAPNAREGVRGLLMFKPGKAETLTRRLCPGLSSGEA